VANPDGRLVASWSTTGTGTRTYELRDAGGAIVGQGPLPGPSGTWISAAATAAACGSRSSTRSAAIPVTPPTRARRRRRAIRIVITPPPAIGSITVDPPQPDAPLTVHYSARARDLHLSIVDRDGKTYFETTTQAGTGSFAFRRRRPARRTVSADRASEGDVAGEQTRISIASAVSPSPSPSPSASPGAVTEQQPRSGGPAATTGATVIETGGSETFTVAPDPVRAGQSFSVEIPFANAARVELVRESRRPELAWVDLRAGDRKVMLTAPLRDGPVHGPVTIQRGWGPKRSVHPLHVTGLR